MEGRERKRGTLIVLSGPSGVSKSTVHKDLTSRLVQVNSQLAAEARKILDVNKSERHIRGGMATREKYLHRKQESLS